MFVAGSDGKDGAQNHLERGGFRLRCPSLRLLPDPRVRPATVPSGAVAVPIRLLSDRGILEQPPPYVVAATSLAILESLVDAQYCPAAGCRGTDWAPIAGVGGDVLLALPVIAGDEIKSVVA